GDVAVTWKNLNAQSNAGSFSLVNASSEVGRKLASGKASSSTVRVMDDAEMGGLLEDLKSAGFYQFAKQGIGLDNLPSGISSKGIVVVQQNGESFGFPYRPTGPGAEANAYANCKKIVMNAHATHASFDVHVGSGEADTRIFDAPPIKPKLGK